MTKDERFIIEIFRAIQTSKEGTADPKEIAKKLGFKEVLTYEILKGLQKANFIKMPTPEAAILTERGEELARSLLT
jgi:Mn-dependent DtxR family transcriptional regulator